VDGEAAVRPGLGIGEQGWGRDVQSSWSSPDPPEDPPEVGSEDPVDPLEPELSEEPDPPEVESEEPLPVPEPFSVEPLPEFPLVSPDPPPDRHSGSDRCSGSAQ
jgi:hypothetical protein